MAVAIAPIVPRTETWTSHSPRGMVMLQGAGVTTFRGQQFTNQIAENHRKRIVFYLITGDHPQSAPFRLPLMSPPADAAPADDLFLSLPPSASIRWQASHKAAVIIAIRAGAITLSEACERYRLSHEELAAWEDAFDQDGMAALQAKYRSSRSHRSD
jgi:hypothetical protein